MNKEHALLKALRDGHLESPDGVIRFRGDTLRRSELGEAIETVDKDLKASEATLLEHDRKCRSYYLGLARQRGQGWPEHLEGLLKLVHYADHSMRNLMDAFRLYQNTLSVVLADGNISSSEAVRLITDCNAMHRVLSELHRHTDQVVLDAATAGHLDKPVWKDNFEPFKLPLADHHNLGDWVDAATGWVGEMISCLSELKIAAMESLLETEHRLEQQQTDAAPAPPRVPQAYATLLEGEERSLQTKLNFWDSFQTATGFFPAALRFAIAALIVCGAIWMTLSEGTFSGLRQALGI